MENRTALVTGATGYIATRLVPALVAAGWDLRATGRRDRPAWLPSGVDYGAIDLAGDDDLGSLVDSVSHVFHLAGASSSRSSQEEMERSNIVGTGRLVDAARAAGASRFVHMSSTSVYGEEVQLPLPITEDVQPQPSRGYGQAKLGAEEAAWKASAEGLGVTVLRPVSVYGPGAVKLVGSAVLDVAIEAFAGLDRLEVPSPAIEQRLVHVDDLVAATIHLAVSDEAVGRAFNIADGVYPTSHEIATVLAGEFGLDVEWSEDPECGPGYDRRRELRDQMLAEGMRDEILFTKERFRFMRKVNRNNRLSIDALLSTGFQLAHTDLAGSIGQSIAWYREQRWVL